MHCSTSHFPVLHYLPEFAQTHVHCQWFHPTILFSVMSFSSCPQSFPASRSFPMSQLFSSSGQSIGASSPVSVLPMNIQGWFPLGLTGLISLHYFRQVKSSIFMSHLRPHCVQSCKGTKVWNMALLYCWKSTNGQIALLVIRFTRHQLARKTIFQKGFCSAVKNSVEPPGLWSQMTVLLCQQWDKISILEASSEAEIQSAAFPSVFQQQ